MANETINIDLIINASKSASTLKEQKEALKAIREGLDNVKQGSGAFELLTDEATRLTSTMDNLALTFEDVYGSGVKPLTSQLGELEDRMYAMALAGDTTSKEFRTLQEEAIRMRKTIIDVDNSVDAFAQKGARLKGFIGIVSGIAGAFAVAQGAAALFGKENKAIEETLLKVQATMAILNGLQELNTLITEKNVIVQRILNTVMKANPIFIILGVITAVIAAWAYFTSETNNVKESVDALNSSMEFQNALLDENRRKALENIDAKIALAEAEGKSDAEILKLKLEKIDEEEKADAKLLETKLANLEKLKKARTDAFFEGEDELAKEIDDKYKAEQKITLDLKDNFKERAGYSSKYDVERALLTKKVETEEKKAQAEITKNNKAETQKKIDAYKAYQEKLTEFDKSYFARLKQINRDIVTLNLEGYDKEFNALVNAQNDRTDIILNQYETEDKFLKESLSKNIITKQQYQLRELENSKRLLNEIYLANKLQGNELNKLAGDIFDENLTLNKSYGIKRVEYLTNNMEKLYELEKSNIDLTISDEKEKSDAILALDIKFKEQRIQLANDLYDAENILALKNYKKTVADLELSLQVNNARIEEANRKTLELEVKRGELLAFLSRTRTQAEIDASNLILSTITTDLETQTKLITNSSLIIENDQAKLRDVYIDYDNQKITSARKLNNTLTKLEQDTTVKTKEELDKRKADIENFTATAINNSLDLLDAIFQSSTNNRISQIDQLLSLQLAAFDEEEAAYWNLTKEQTNAEKFKADKQAEFDKKRAAIEAKAEKEKNEAQFKGEIRAWEFSQAQAAVNLANALLKAAPNPFLLATTGALGVIELATIVANKPVKNFATGGLITGPGNGTSDSIPANLSNGESVMNAKSTKMFLPLLDMINQAGGGVPLINGGKKFSTGGMVTNVNVDNSQLATIMEQFFKQPIKTYVTSSDVTNAQGGDNRLKSRTTF